jgi:hypothetical protein
MGFMKYKSLVVLTLEVHRSVFPDLYFQKGAGHECRNQNVKQ